MRVKDKTTFQSQGFYNLTTNIQENTLLNRGLIDIGGLVVPQMIMSNNKDETIERGSIGGLYFLSSFVAPFVLLPFFNKSFLRKSGLVKNFNNQERRIIEVSKEYLMKDADFMLKGIRETAEKIESDALKKGQKINIKQDFENVINRFENKDELKNKLLKTHENVLFADFLATAWMWCAIPWIGMSLTKLRTNRSGFSATYKMVDESQSEKNAQKHEKEKKRKLLISALIGTIPAFIFPKLVTKGIKNKSGILSNIVKKLPQSFNYTKGIFPSKLIFGSIWVLCDYPSQIVSARDKYETRDRIIRGAGNILVFFGGDFILNNILGRLSDKSLGTKIMDRSKLKSENQFFKKLLMQPENFADMGNLKGVSAQVLKRTKNVGAGLYWLTLVANMGLLGFALPAFLNRLLRKTISKETSSSKSGEINYALFNNKNGFDKFRLD